MITSFALALDFVGGCACYLRLFMYIVLLIWVLGYLDWFTCEVFLLWLQPSYYLGLGFNLLVFVACVFLGLLIARCSFCDVRLVVWFADFACVF